MNTYIKLDYRVHYFEIDATLNPELYDLGETYQDYLDNKWVLLSDEQVAFHNEHPHASIKEVFDMFIPEPVIPVRTIEQARQEKLWQIDSYDNSNQVNGFVLSGALMWFNANERLGYKESIQAARLLGESFVEIFIGDNLVAVPCDVAEMMLAQLQRYADKCFNVTKQHKMNVEKLEDIEAVDGYDYMSGYPTMLTFELPMMPEEEVPVVEEETPVVEDELLDEESTEEVGE